MSHSPFCTRAWSRVPQISARPHAKRSPRASLCGRPRQRSGEAGQDPALDLVTGSPGWLNADVDNLPYEADNTDQERWLPNSVLAPIPGHRTCPRVPGTTGNPISFEEVRIDRYANGKIVKSWFIPDRMTLWQQSVSFPRRRNTPHHRAHIPLAMVATTWPDSSPRERDGKLPQYAHARR